MTTTENTAIAIVVPEREQLPPSLLANIETGFREAFAQAEKWRVQALAINVTSADQKTEMKLARTIRLELKNIRVSAEKTRKTLKEDALRMGKAIDGVNNLLLAAIVPLEKHLEEQEQYGERLAEAERQATLARRTAELAPYLTEGQQVPALDVMSAEQFANYITDAKLLHEAKIEQSRKAEAERIAAEQAAAAERERLRIENERLRQEAAERETAAKAEREAAERELARWIYAAQSDTPGGTRASFWNSAPPGPWRNGSLKMGNTDFTYAIYAETLNYAGGSTNVGMGTAATANRLKKVDIVVWWWDGQIRDARPPAD